MPKGITYAREKEKEYDRRYYLKHRKQLIKHVKEWRINLRKKIMKKIGERCFICGKKPNRISFHEIHGKPHGTSRLKYILKHHQDFIPLCNGCHVTLHRLYNRKEKYLQLLNKLEGEHHA